MRLSDIILVSFAVLTTALAVILFIFVNDDFSTEFIIAQVLIMIGYYFLYFGFAKFEKKEHMLFWFCVFSAFFIVSCFLQGGQAGIWSTIISISRNIFVITDIILFKKEKRRLSNVAYYLIIIVLFIVPIAVTGFTSKDFIETLFAALFTGFSTMETSFYRYKGDDENESKKQKRYIAVPNIFLCLLYITYDALIGLWFAVPLEAGVLFYTLVWWLRKDSKIENI